MFYSKLLNSYKEISYAFLVDGQEDCGESPEQWVTANQVHGSSVRIVESNQRHDGQADALVTQNIVTVAVKTADCLPILIFENKRKVVAAVHAGWKGLYKGIIENTIDAITSLGGKSNNCLAVIGPHIRACCYSVSKERLGNFLDLGLSKKAISRKENGKWFLNLEKIALLKLHALCIKSQSMECIRLCTSCDERFPSFRRDRRVDKKILSAIGLKQ